MYGFSGYGTNEYGASRYGLKKILAIVAQRTVVLLTNLSTSIIAMTNQIRTTMLATNTKRNAIAMTNQIRRVEAEENKSQTLTLLLRKNLVMVADPSLLHEM